MTKEVTYYGILKLCHYNQGFQLENAQIQQGSRIRKFLPSVVRGNLPPEGNFL